MTNSLKAAVCASLVLGSVFSGFASEGLVDHVLDGVQESGSFVAEAGKTVLNSVKNGSTYVLDHAGKLVDKAGNGLKEAGKATQKAGSDVVAYVQKSDMYKSASDKASGILGWAQDNTPVALKTFITAHPIYTGVAIVAPFVLYIGYKCWAPQPEEQRKDIK